MKGENIMSSIWRIFWDPNDPDYTDNLKNARKLCADVGVSEFLSKLLVARGIVDAQEAKIFLEPGMENVFDPFLMKDMEKAVQKLLEIRQKKEKLVIFGDYDVDGVTSASLLYLGLNEMGFDTQAYIPSRMDEGYSLNTDAIEDFRNKKYQNILTVDCGVTSVQEIKYAKELGMTVIVTDHHEPPKELPCADAIVNPKRLDDEYPFKGLAGVGVAFKLLTAVKSKIEIDFDPFSLIDLVAVGTIADIVPLLSENRYFVRKGIEKIKQSPIAGLEALIKELRIQKEEITSQIIAYKIAPKINAAGRMADAFTAFKLLISQNHEEISKNVSSLIKLNTKRQAKEKEIYLYALSLIDVNPELKESKVIVLSGENWHLGVLGIVASKLSALYNKPVLLVSKDEHSAKGSARSPAGINLMELFKEASKYNVFKEFGGHELAAGFTIDSQDIDALRISVNKAYEELYKEHVPYYEVFIDMEIENVWNSFFEDIERLEPFGYRNPEPTFLIMNSHVDNFKFFGNGVENFAAKMRSQKDLIMDVIGYGLSQKMLDLRYNSQLNLNMDMVGNFRVEKIHNSKISYLKYYLKDFEIKNFDVNSCEYKNVETNIILRDEIIRIGKLNVITDNLSSEKVSMFLPPRIKYATMLKKISDSLSASRKVVIIGSSHIVLSHTYSIVSSYITPSNIYYNKKSRINSKVLSHESVFFVTLPAFLNNLSFFNGDNFDLIVDEPYYMISHPAVQNMNDYNEFKKFISVKKSNIMVIGSLFTENIKDFFKHAGYKVLLANFNTFNYEVTKEEKPLLNILMDYNGSYGKKLIVINEKRKQEIISDLITEKFSIVEESIKKFSGDMDFSKKLLLRESIKKDSVNYLITSYSNNGIAMDMKDSFPTFILLEVPKCRLELIDLVSSWNVGKKGSINLVLAYDDKFKTKMMYELQRMYPPASILKHTYDYIKNNPGIKESELITNLFKGDIEFCRTVFDELSDTGMVLNVSNKLEVFEEFDIKNIHNGLRVRESILDTYLIKNSIKTFESYDSRKIMDMFRVNLSE